jgi:hypothetical protein
MIAATLALAAPSHSMQMPTVYELGRIEPTCISDFGDKGFVVQMPKTPAYGSNRLLRLIKTPGAGQMKPLTGDNRRVCIVKAEDSR